MTFDELNKKYPESREEMDTERERAFLKDCYDAYETDGFTDKFWTPFDTPDKKYVGQPFKVIGRCEEGTEFDLCSLPSWEIEFEDGYKTFAYPEEIYLKDMIANGYMEPKETQDCIQDILEKNDFVLLGDTQWQNGECYLEFGQSTPEGEDWTETIWFNGSIESFVDALKQRALTFDIDDEVEPYISCRGKYGCPSSISDLIADAEWKKDALLSLSTNFDDAVYGAKLSEQKSLDKNKDELSQKEQELSDFNVGQKVKYVTNDDPFTPVKEHIGTVKAIFEDHMIVDVPDISDHCWFEPDFNLNQLIPIPLEDNKALVEKIWDRFYAPYDKYTEEDHDRITSELCMELEECGENAFMLRTVMQDIVNQPQPAILNLYRGDMTSSAWEEIANAFYVDPDDLKDNIDLHAFLIDGIRE